MVKMKKSLLRYEIIKFLIFFIECFFWLFQVIPSTAGVENGYGGEEHSAACYIKAAHVVV